MMANIAFGEIPAPQPDVGRQIQEKKQGLDLGLSGSIVYF
jgi:hypothetical protein